ncbi:MAG: HAD family hydrolase [Planctomycetes bacterium]|nr:HAD family hydrolase [Planctomycetota bacterium]
MPKLKAVYFDVDGTLWDRAACDRHVMEIVLQRFAESLPQEGTGPIIRRFNAVFFQLLEREHLRASRPFSRLRRFEALLESYKISPRGLAHELNRTYDATRRLMMRQFLRRDALHVLKELKRRGLQRGVVMNGQPAVQRHLLETLGLTPHLDHSVLADVEGFLKPDARLFKRTLEAAGLRPKQMLYVGDSPLTDTLGASRAGIPTVWFNADGRPEPRGWPTPDFTISDLSELLSIVGT